MSDIFKNERTDDMLAHRPESGVSTVPFVKQLGTVLREKGQVPRATMRLAEAELVALRVGHHDVSAGILLQAGRTGGGQPGGGLGDPGPPLG